MKGALTLHPDGLISYRSDSVFLFLTAPRVIITSQNLDPQGTDQNMLIKMVTVKNRWIKAICDHDDLCISFANEIQHVVMATVYRAAIYSTSCPLIDHN